jgi:hypothetical protein
MRDIYSRIMIEFFLTRIFFTKLCEKEPQLVIHLDKLFSVNLWVESGNFRMRFINFYKINNITFSTLAKIDFFFLISLYT